MWRALAALLIGSALVCAAAPAARAASNALWIVDSAHQRVEEYLPSEIKKSGTPTPAAVSAGNYAYGACFDKSNNLWVTVDGVSIVKFSASKLKKLPISPSPAETITSSSFVFIESCTFDKAGNLWVVDANNNSLDEILAAHLTAGGSLTPDVIITDSAELSFADLGFLAFDKSGNLWFDGGDDEEIFQFSASQLTSTGDKTAAVVLRGGGSLYDPGQIAFDAKGNLWVTSYGFDTVVMFSTSQLGASNNDAPAVTISSSGMNGPFGLAFSGANLWMLNFEGGNAMEFSSAQLKSSGAPTPKVILTGAAGTDNWGILFGPALGK